MRRSPSRPRFGLFWCERRGSSSSSSRRSWASPAHKRPTPIFSASASPPIASHRSATPAPIPSRSRAAKSSGHSTRRSSRIFRRLPTARTRRISPDYSSTSNHFPERISSRDCSPRPPLRRATRKFRCVARPSFAPMAAAPQTAPPIRSATHSSSKSTKRCCVSSIFKRRASRTVTPTNLPSCARRSKASRPHW